VVGKTPLSLSTSLPGAQYARLYTTKEAARFLRISHRTLEDWRLTGEGPYFIKLGRRVLYRESDLLAFIADRSRKNTGKELAH